MNKVLFPVKSLGRRLSCCKKMRISYHIIAIFFILGGCVEHTLIPGQLNQQIEMSRVVPPNHHELLQGGLLKQKIASDKLTDRMRFIAFYPLHLIAMGNFIEEGEVEKSLPSFEREFVDDNSVTAKNRESYKIQEMMLSEDPEERELGVGLQNFSQDEKTFVASLYNDDPYVRLASVHLLKDYEFNIVKSHFMALLHDSNEFVRLEIVRQLKHFQRRDILPFVYKALIDEAPFVRAEAVVTITSLGFLDGVAKLWPILDDSEIYVRKKAVDALEILTSIAVDYPYQGSVEIRNNKLTEWKKRWYQKQGILDNGK